MAIPLHTVAGSATATIEWQSSRGSRPFHAIAWHGVHEWARGAHGDGICAVHCDTCGGVGAALRTYLRVFRGVHKQYQYLYVATYGAMLNPKRLTPTLIQRICSRISAGHAKDT